MAPTRRSFAPRLTAALLAALALGSTTPAPVAGLAAQIPVYDGPPPTAVVSYGDHPQQFGNLRLPEGDGPHPVAVVVHGGCWFDWLGEGSLTPAAAALTAAGVATWDAEYRRLGHAGGGWPGTFLDVGAAVDHLRVLAEDYPLDLQRVVIVGHSSGAQLAAWAAARPELPAGSEIRGDDPVPVRAAVGIDGPMDLASWSRNGVDGAVCGEPVIASLLGGTPDEVPGRYAQASPIEMPGATAALHLVPAEMVLQTGGHDAMVARGAETGQVVRVRPVPTSDHFQLITPDDERWMPVLDEILRALGVRPGG